MNKHSAHVSFHELHSFLHGGLLAKTRSGPWVLPTGAFGWGIGECFDKNHVMIGFRNAWKKHAKIAIKGIRKTTILKGRIELEVGSRTRPRDRWRPREASVTEAARDPVRGGRRRPSTFDCTFAQAAASRTDPGARCRSTARGSSDWQQRSG
jgi:hypothetical protein